MKCKKSSFILIFLILLSAPIVVSALSPKNEYVGTEVCKTCHEKEYEAWKTSGHARILHKSSDAEINTIPLPAGYDKKTVSYVIGVISEDERISE